MYSEQSSVEYTGCCIMFALWQYIVTLFSMARRHLCKMGQGIDDFLTRFFLVKGKINIRAL